MALVIKNARIQSSSFKARTQSVDTLVLHYTALDLQASLQVLRSRDVSVHYVLAPDGTAYKILEDDEVGYHAGLSMWRGKAKVNDRSIGIEIVNLDGSKHAYPEAQVAALVELCKHVASGNPGIAQENIVGHSDIAPKRKVDPGLLFPWERLAENGVGLWPIGAAGAANATPDEIQRLLEQIGYPARHAYGRKGDAMVYVADADNPPAGVSNLVRVGTNDIVRAFQARFRPIKADGVIDATTVTLVRRLAEMVGAG